MNHIILHQKNKIRYTRKIQDSCNPIQNPQIPEICRMNTVGMEMTHKCRKGQEWGVEIDSQNKDMLYHTESLLNPSHHVKN